MNIESVYTKIVEIATEQGKQSGMIKALHEDNQFFKKELIDIKKDAGKMDSKIDEHIIISETIKDMNSGRTKRRWRKTDIILASIAIGGPLTISIIALIL